MRRNCYFKMPNSRLEPETKLMIPLIKKEFLRNNPKFEGMRLTEDFLIRKAFIYYLTNTPFAKELNNMEIDEK